MNQQQQITNIRASAA